MAPRLEGVYGSHVHLEGGQIVIADDDYIRESILKPNAKIVQGFKPIMPTFQGLVTEEDLLDLTAYIQSLKYSDGHEGEIYETGLPKLSQ